VDSVGVLCQVVMVGCFGITDDKNVIYISGVFKYQDDARSNTHKIYTTLTFGHNENFDIVMDTLSDVTSFRKRTSKL